MAPFPGTAHGLLRRVDACDAFLLAARAAAGLFGAGDFAES